jgi:polyphosphate glucokinase
MRILTIDVGGSHVKVLATGQTEPRRVESGPSMTAADMVAVVKHIAADWTYDVISIGYPGPVVNNVPIKEPANLGRGWVGFDFAAAFGRPVKIINDAAMQALGSDDGGRLLFLGFGTGFGSAMVIDGRVEPMELAHLPYKKKRTYEDYVGQRGLKRLGKKKWRREVTVVINELSAALGPDYVVVGGGNIDVLRDLPPRTRLGANSNAFQGGFRLWREATTLATLNNHAVAISPPRCTPELHLEESPRALFRAAAAEIVDQAVDAVMKRGSFRVALSGGSTPRGLFSLLATDPNLRERMPWGQIQFFWTDERHVPPFHPDSNFRMADETLLSVVPVPSANVHPIPGESAHAHEAAASYESELRAFFDLRREQLPRFDLIMLGLGAEGHTASLFPGTHALDESEHLVVASWVGKLDADRITLTARVLNNAASVLFLVSGAEKALALKAVLEGPYEPHQLPAQLVNPSNGRLVWLFDQAAGQLLEAAPAAVVETGVEHRHRARAVQGPAPWS